MILFGNQGQMLDNLVYNGFKGITVVILNLPCIAKHSESGIKG